MSTKEFTEATYLLRTVSHDRIEKRANSCHVCTNCKQLEKWYEVGSCETVVVVDIYAFMGFQENSIGDTEFLILRVQGFVYYTYETRCLSKK